MERKCYNCGDTSHISIRCPHQQKYTRCPICDKACFSDISHATSCKNTEFRSTLIGEQSTVHSIEEIISIEMKPVSEFAVVSSSGEKSIKKGTVWLSNANMQINANEGKLLFSGTVERRRTILFIDEENNRRLKIDIEPERIFVNTHYKISKNGYIGYNRYEEQNMYGRADCTIKFTSDQYVVHSRLTWHSAVYFLDLFPDGALLVDPIKLYFEKNLKVRVRNDHQNNEQAENVDGAHSVSEENENLIEQPHDSNEQSSQSSIDTKEFERMILESFEGVNTNENANDNIGDTTDEEKAECGNDEKSEVIVSPNEKFQSEETDAIVDK